MPAIPNGVPIGLDELIATRERWVREHLEQRPGWWRPLARLAWRAELEQLEVLPLGQVAARMRGA